VASGGKGRVHARIAARSYSTATPRHCCLCHRATADRWSFCIEHSSPPWRWWAICALMPWQVTCDVHWMISIRFLKMDCIDQSERKRPWAAIGRRTIGAFRQDRRATAKKKVFQQEVCKDGQATTPMPPWGTRTRDTICHNLNNRATPNHLRDQESQNNLYLLVGQIKTRYMGPVCVVL